MAAALGARRSRGGEGAEAVEWGGVNAAASSRRSGGGGGARGGRELRDGRREAGGRHGEGEGRAAGG
jgi:hypothetical protein